MTPVDLSFIDLPCMQIRLVPHPNTPNGPAVLIADSGMVDLSDRRAAVMAITDVGAAKSSGSVDVASGNSLDELVAVPSSDEQQRWNLPSG